MNLTVNASEKDMTEKTHERVAIVAGVGPGLGAALVRKLAEEGCRVGMFARSPKETPSGTHRDFCRPRKDRQTPFRGSDQAHDCIERQCRQRPPHACSLAVPPPQSSANKEQRARIYESKNFRAQSGERARLGCWQRRPRLCGLCHRLKFVVAGRNDPHVRHGESVLWRTRRVCSPIQDASVSSVATRLWRVCEKRRTAPWLHPIPFVSIRVHWWLIPHKRESAGRIFISRRWGSLTAYLFSSDKRSTYFLTPFPTFWIDNVAVRAVPQAPSPSSTLTV